MRISEIKRLTDKRRVRKIITYLWEFDSFRSALSYFHKADCTIHDIYDVIVNTFFRLLDEDSQSEKIILFRREIQNLSKALYGNPAAWAAGTKWEEEANASVAQAEEKRRIKHERREQLEKLYDMLSLEKVGNRDIIRLIILDYELFFAVLAKSEEGLTRCKLYDICEEILLPRIINDSFVWRDYYILCMASAIAFKNWRYWAESNGLSIEEFDSKFSRRKKTQDSETDE